MRPVVAADGEASDRGIGRLGGAELAVVGLDVRSVRQAAVLKNRQHRDRSAEIVGHQHEPPGRVDTQVGGAGAARADSIERLQFSIRPVDGEGTDRAFLVFARPVGFIGGVQAVAGGVHRQATRTCAHRMDASGGQRPGGTIRPEQVDALAVAGRQVHLSRHGIAERGTKGADVGEERTGDFVRLRPQRWVRERGGRREGDGGLDKRTPGAVERRHG